MKFLINFNLIRKKIISSGRKYENYFKVISVGVLIGVFFNGLEGEIIDVKVFIKRGLDDVIYDKNKEIRKRVRRVYCLYI